MDWSSSRVRVVYVHVKVRGHEPVVEEAKERMVEGWEVEFGFEVELL